jgi:FKBP-type peptidyl-prolyl cis-trans isomerase
MLGVGSSLRSSPRSRWSASFALCAVGVAAIGVSFTTAQDRADPSPSNVGYAIGFDLGRDIATELSADGVNVDRASIVKGLSDALQGRDPSISDDEIESILTIVHRRVAERRAQERYDRDPVFRALAERNKESGDTFRRAFAQREGARILPSGVIYSIVREGTGQPVGDAQVVVANFVAMFPDGTEYRRGRGVEFRVATLLPGVQDFVRQMRVGERAYVAVPPERAHGLAGDDTGEIGPNATVVIDVEIVDAKR